jgi:hypothetical protein
MGERWCGNGGMLGVRHNVGTLNGVPANFQGQNNTNNTNDANSRQRFLSAVSLQSLNVLVNRPVS